nr:MAG TPA: hypothetical protein [Caudoviricetes sp.]
MRLIDADAVKFNFQYGRDDNGILLVPYRDAKKLIEAAKTVDAVLVVRCRDCRKFKTYGCRMVASGYDDFCSYGERKEGDTDGS